ncbi:MAG: hypothetical protein K0B11_16790 [Mariniphaga sp.]|nr:hypothetical protein [Mariniphaga sp.]
MKTKPMYTIAKLIEELKKFPQDMPVVTNGYEGEFENILPPKIISVKFVPDQPYYDGQFQQTDSNDPLAIKAVTIEREVRF